MNKLLTNSWIQLKSKPNRNGNCALVYMATLAGSTYYAEELPEGHRALNCVYPVPASVVKERIKLAQAQKEAGLGIHRHNIPEQLERYTVSMQVQGHEPMVHTSNDLKESKLAYAGFKHASTLGGNNNLVLHVELRDNAQGIQLRSYDAYTGKEYRFNG